MAILDTTYMGIPLKNPIIAASSGLTDSIKNLVEIQHAGAGAVVLKSLFEEEIRIDMDARLKKMGSETFLYPETLEYYENFENTTEESTQKYLKLIKQAKKDLTIPVIASINCVTAEQWTYFPRQIEQAGADGLELNVFLMPSDVNMTAADTEKAYLNIIEEVLKHVRIPVALKMSYYFSNLASIIRTFSKTDLSALVLFNRFYSPDYDLHKMEITSANVLSSPEDLPLSLRWIAIMAGQVDCDLAATTGIHTGEAVIKQLLAGATAVQVASTLYKNGIGYLQTMLNALESWMEENNYSNIDSFRGKMAMNSIKNPAAYERVQFMKYFRGYEYTR